MAIDPVSIGTAAIPLLAGLFKSKKHYNLYYFEEASDQWMFVMEDIPSRIKPYANDYKSRGIAIAIVRNKGGNFNAAELMPKEPPKGYTPNTPATTNYLTIALVVGGVLAILYFILKKRKR
jgi:hypothetical protein